jgi:IS605 OrfB family transposase
VTKQGYRIEFDPTAEQRVVMGRHAGLSRFVENFCLDKIQAAFAQRAAEASYGIPAAQQTKASWSGIDLEKLWRAEHSTVAPWFAESGLSSRIPKEACRLRAAGLKNWWESKTGKRKGPKLRFPTLRKRKHGSRFRYDADRAKPVGPDAVTLPGIPGKVSVREPMNWLVDRVAAGLARIIGGTVRERAGRWWVTFQIEVDRGDLNARRAGLPDKLTTRLARSKRAIAVETLNVAGMKRNRWLARAICDAGFGEFLRQLTYKTGWYGSKVWAADRWYPSSKTCSACGAVNSGLTLADRMWLCQCGVEHDRDHNAARNLLAAMHAAH